MYINIWPNCAIEKIYEYNNWRQRRRWNLFLETWRPTFDVNQIRLQVERVCSPLGSRRLSHTYSYECKTRLGNSCEQRGCFEYQLPQQLRLAPIFLLLFFTTLRISEGCSGAINTSMYVEDCKYSYNHKSCKKTQFNSFYSLLFISFHFFPVKESNWMR